MNDYPKKSLATSTMSTGDGACSLTEAEVRKYLTEINQQIRKGCSVHITQDKRLYYLNHEVKVSSWLPPVESWNSGEISLPYGWEVAVDSNGKRYFINHVNKTTTYEDPGKDMDEEPPPQPREVELFRDLHLGFGFVAGSEKPVIVRFVTEGGPSENKLMPGDQILEINGENVVKAPRERVIELVRSCTQSVLLTVCQPHANNSTRKSALLTAAKKAKLKTNPSRVRFAEGVVINGSPLYYPSPFDSCAPCMPNVMKVFLENGQTKSFKYDSTTTVQDVLISLHEKLSIKCPMHFCLVVEHIKSLRKNKLRILDPADTLAKIAARPGAHHLRCLFRVTFVPKDAYDLLQKDPVAFEYLYLQSCNDVVQERFAPELKYDVALRLSALHIQQHVLSNGLQGKLTIKSIERECGLERFVPCSLLETMKRKELRKVLNHYLKQNQALSAPGQKQLTALQAKLHYLKIISELPSYGAKCFSTNLKDSSVETCLLLSPKVGISQMNSLRNSVPFSLASIEEVTSSVITKEDELSCTVDLSLKDPDKENLTFSLEDQEAQEFILLLKGYYNLMTGKELSVHWEMVDPWRSELAPHYHSCHIVQEAPWSYIIRPDVVNSGPKTHLIDFAIPPPSYIPCEVVEHGVSRSTSRDSYFIPRNPDPAAIDHNMNETRSMSIAEIPMRGMDRPLTGFSLHDSVVHPFETLTPQADGTDVLQPSSLQEPVGSVLTLEMLEGGEDKIDLTLFEAKNDEVIRRVTEMKRIVAAAEHYLADEKDGMSDIVHRDEDDDVEVKSQIKAADSLLLLTQIDGMSETESDQGFPEVSPKPSTDISPVESDTDSTSTPNSSPLHSSVQVRNCSSSDRTGRKGSSFGLHSPDMLPGIDPTGQDIADIIRQLQTNSEVQLPFAEGTLYLDPDIIDLTMIPPPITPDADTQDTPRPLEHPPSDFIDKSLLLRAVAAVSGNSHVSSCGVDLDTSGLSSPYPDDGDLEVAEDDGTSRATLDSADVVAQLDYLCDALSELQGTVLSEEYQDTTNGELEDLLQTDDIDMFIASMTVPPPPQPPPLHMPDVSQQGELVHCDDISAFIIPPPPRTCHSLENEVIARFHQASEDIRKVIESSGCSSSTQQSVSHDNQAPAVAETFNFVDEKEFIGCDSSESETTSFKYISDSTCPESSNHCSENSSPYDGSLVRYMQSRRFFSGFSSLDTKTAGPACDDTQGIPLSSSEFGEMSCDYTCTDSTDSVFDVAAESHKSLTQERFHGDARPIAPPRMKKNSASDMDNVELPEGTHWPTGKNVCPPVDDSKYNLIRSSSCSRLNGVKANVASPKNPLTRPPPSPLTPERAKRLLAKGLHNEKCAGSLETGSRQNGEGNDMQNVSTRVSPIGLKSFLNKPSVPRNKPQLTSKVVNGMRCESPLSRSSSQHEESIICSNFLTNNSEQHSETGKRGCLFGDNLQLIYTSDFLTRNKFSVLEIIRCNTTEEFNSSYIQTDTGKCSKLFSHAQRDICAMVMHLDEMSQNWMRCLEGCDSNGEKFVLAKEALLTVSRQFVTASKLFVKCATESDDQVEDSFASCLALLSHIFAVSEVILVHLSTEDQVTLLSDRLKDVALTFLQTIEAMSPAPNSSADDNSMSALMRQATALASALTSLMRVLRSFAVPPTNGV